MSNMLRGLYYPPHDEPESYPDPRVVRLEREVAELRRRLAALEALAELDTRGSK